MRTATLKAWSLASGPGKPKAPAHPSSPSDHYRRHIVVCKEFSWYYTIVFQSRPTVNSVLGRRVSGLVGCWNGNRIVWLRCIGWMHGGIRLAWMHQALMIGRLEPRIGVSCHVEKYNLCQYNLVVNIYYLTIISAVFTSRIPPLLMSSIYFSSNRASYAATHFKRCVHFFGPACVEQKWGEL